MMAHLLLWSLFGGMVAALLGIMFGKGDPAAPLVLGGLGVFLGTLGGILATRLQAGMEKSARHMDYPAIGGCLVGMISGGVVGAYSGFGRVMIALFNPDLPYRDFGASFGAIGGGFLGAILGACTVSLLVKRLRR